MSIYFRTVSILVATSTMALMGCKDPEEIKVKVPSYQAPDIKITLPEDIVKNFDEYLKSMNTCDKPESELPSLDEASKNTFKIEAEIPIQDFETTKCDGTVTKGKGPNGILNEKIQIEADNGLGENVETISVENFRTCRAMAVKANREKLGPSRVNTPAGEPVDVPTVLSNATRSGDLELFLSDSTSKFDPHLNIQNGKNVVQIKYLGKCLKLSDTETNLDGSKKCMESEVLKEKFILIQADIKHPKIPGVRQEKESCGNR